MPYEVLRFDFSLRTVESTTLPYKNPGDNGLAFKKHLCEWAGMVMQRPRLEQLFMNCTIRQRRVRGRMECLK